MTSGIDKDEGEALKVSLALVNKASIEKESRRSVVGHRGSVKRLGNGAYKKGEEGLRKFEKLRQEGNSRYGVPRRR